MMSQPIGSSIGDGDLPSSTEAGAGELRRLTRALRTLSAGNRILLRASDEQELLEGMCRVIVDAGGYGFAAVSFVEHDVQKTLPQTAYALPAVHELALTFRHLCRINMRRAIRRRGVVFLCATHAKKGVTKNAKNYAVLVVR